jgi:hypothetical protein
MSKPETVDLSQEARDELMQRLTSDTLTADDRALLGKCLNFMAWLQDQLQYAKINLDKLRKLFNIIPRNRQRNNKKKDLELPDSDLSDVLDTTDKNDSMGINTSDNKQPEPRSRTGGRLSANSYNADETIFLPYEQGKTGSPCPEGCGGRLYHYGESVVIRITGQGFAKITRFNLEQVRCSRCGELKTASLPAAYQQKYDARFKAILSLQKYYLGTPFYAIERFQNAIKQPLPDATQWMLCEEVADCVYPVRRILERLVAADDKVSYDDTRVRILSHLKSIMDNPKMKRRGCYTTAVLGAHQNHPITLFYSSPKHAGENMARILSLRDKALPPIKTMSDALSANLTHDFKVILCHCLSHGLRKFSELEYVFPEGCQFVLQILRKVYYFDEQTKKMGDDERLFYHQQHSLPLMNTLYAWLNQQRDERRVEPNSPLGKSINYMLNHWYALTQFTRVPGALIDNNHVERALKMPIRTRKMAMFHKTEHGAYVAALLMSLIQTAIDNNANPVDYLTALQENKSHVFKEPQLWLPWNYRHQLQLISDLACAA